MPNRTEPDLNATPRRILVPIDEEHTAGSFSRAAALASALGAELLLLGVNPVPVLADAMPSSMALAVDSADRQADQDLIERLTRERVLEAQGRLPAGVRSRAVFGWGPAGPAIVDAARKEAADLIVVPMHDGGALSHLLHDGADRHVLHKSAVPVLVVPEA